MIEGCHTTYPTQLPLAFLISIQLTYHTFKLKLASKLTFTEFRLRRPLSALPNGFD